TDGQNTLTEDHCKHLLTSVVLPVSDNNEYILKYSSSAVGAENLKVYHKTYSNTYYNFQYVEGSRISKIAYFKNNVGKNILNTPTGEATAEKFIAFDYSDQFEANTSSGRIRTLGIEGKELSPFNVIYDQVTTTIRGIGNQFAKYDFPYNSNWDKYIRTDVKETKVYDVSDQLVSATNYQYTYYTLPSTQTDYKDTKPFVSASNAVSKNYEGADYVTSSVSNTYSTNN